MSLRAGTAEPGTLVSQPAAALYNERWVDTAPRGGAALGRNIAGHDDTDMSESEPQTAMPKPKLRWYQYRLRTLLLLALLCAIALKAGLEWQRRRRMEIARNWARACLDQEYPDCGRMDRDKPWPPLPACPASLDETLRPIILKMAVTQLESPRERIAGLRVLLESSPATALAMLREGLRDERDPQVKAVELRLVGLYRNATSADMVFQHLDDADARVRAAAADALGLIHCPAYPIFPFRFFTNDDAFASDPPIDLRPLLECVMDQGKSPPDSRNIDDCLPMNVIELPAAMRAALETMMLDGPSSEERMAAARALLAWPPADYRLRVAEWGVWINDGGQLRLAQAVLDEIPPFVHRTGNTVASLSDRLMPIMVITKPIMHFTADRPLVADVEVLISQGRPWFAYPRPEDFTMLASPGYGSLGNRRDPGLVLAVFDKAHVPELQPTAEGYPWLAPPHRTYGSYSASMGGGPNEITDLGLRWQSLIISPDQQSWMTPPSIEDRRRYGWWEQLRSVPSCWLSSQGESERFLYYDGPTHKSSPVQAVVKGKRLHLKSFPMPDTTVWKPEADCCPLAPFACQAVGDYGTKRHGLYIEVTSGQSAARIVHVADGQSDVDLEALAPMTSATAQKHLLAMLTEYGLTADEASGLADVWKRQFWETPGKRLLVILSANDYDAMCPLHIRPKPTELVRLGVLLTELPP